MFGDAVRDLLDPMLRGGVGRLGTYCAKSIKKTATERGYRRAPHAFTRVIRTAMTGSASIAIARY